MNSTRKKLEEIKELNLLISFCEDELQDAHCPAGEHLIAELNSIKEERDELLKSLEN